MSSERRDSRAGLLSLDPSSDPSSLLASLTMGTEVEVQFGKSLQARPFPLRQRGTSLFRLFGFSCKLRLFGCLFQKLHPCSAPVCLGV